MRTRQFAGKEADCLHQGMSGPALLTPCLSHAAFRLCQRLRFTCGTRTANQKPVQMIWKLFLRRRNFLLIFLNSRLMPAGILKKILLIVLLWPFLTQAQGDLYSNSFIKVKGGKGKAI